MRHALIALAFLAFLMSAPGCGTPRRYGDDGGRPTAFRVQLERAFINGMADRQARVGVGAGGTIGSGGHRSLGVGIGLSFQSTEVYLLGGETAGGAQVFRQELSWGENTFTVPLQPGRTLHLTVQAMGGREGWEVVGQAVVPDVPQPAVTVTLTATGGTVEAR